MFHLRGQIEDLCERLRARVQYLAAVRRGEILPDLALLSGRGSASSGDRKLVRCCFQEHCAYHPVDLDFVNPASMRSRGQVVTWGAVMFWELLFDEKTLSCDLPAYDSEEMRAEAASYMECFGSTLVAGVLKSSAEEGLA